MDAKYKWTISDAAAKLGLSKERVYKARQEFGLGVRVGKRVLLLSDKDLEIIASRIGEVGRPKNG